MGKRGNNVRLNGEEEKTQKEEGGRGGGVVAFWLCQTEWHGNILFSQKRHKKKINNEKKKIIFSALLIPLGSLPPSLSSMCSANTAGDLERKRCGS